MALRIDPQTLLAVIASFYEEAAILAEDNQRLREQNAQPVEDRTQEGESEPIRVG